MSLRLTKVDENEATIRIEGILDYSPSLEGREYMGMAFLVWVSYEDFRVKAKPKWHSVK